MRKTRDGETTKNTVITTARQVFAERGFAGTSLAMISARCGISEGLILHHFKNKKNLYKMILQDLARNYAETISGAMIASKDPQQAAGEMLQTIFRYWSEDTLYARIAMWAYLEGQDELVDEELKLTKNLADAVRQMQASGAADSKFSPFVLLTMTIGPIQFWVRQRELFQQALFPGESMQALNDLFLKQYIGLVRKLYQPENDLQEKGEGEE